MSMCRCNMFHRSIGNNCDSLWPNDVVNPSLQVVVMTWSSMLSNLTWAATPRRRRRQPDHTRRSREGRSKCRTSFERKLPSRHDLGGAKHDSWVTIGNLSESKKVLYYFSRPNIMCGSHVSANLEDILWLIRICWLYFITPFWNMPMIFTTDLSDA